MARRRFPRLLRPVDAAGEGVGLVRKPVVAARSGLGRLPQQVGDSPPGRWPAFIAASSSAIGPCVS